jgi:hypothetical protein
MQGVIPVLGGLILYFLGGWAVWEDYDVNTGQSYTHWKVPGLHWEIGGAFIIIALAAIIGVLFFIYCRITNPAFFKKQTLTRSTPTLIPDE